MGCVFLEELKTIFLDAAEKEGVDIVGFASKDRFASVDARNNPFSIFPEGNTVIMIGKRVCRGSLRGVEEGTNFGDYNLFGKNWLEDEFLSLACYDLVRVLEDHGWEAVPVFPNPSELKPTGVPVAQDRPAPNVFPDFDYAAVACGVGEIGLNGMLLTPRFGPRQRFHMIITDAELPSTPLLEQQICDGCGECAAVCPLGAIDVDAAHEVDICGKKMKVASVDYEKCKTCRNGACRNRLADYARPDRMAALCNRTCVSHLEGCGLVGNRFELPFRKREAWAIDGAGAYAKRDTESANVLGGAFSKDGNRGAR